MATTSLQEVARQSSLCFPTSNIEKLMPQIVVTCEALIG